jgi:pimeloyl-ACP methyl ester carboxylesterase
VPPELLADPDSNFTPVGELWVHWKEALPPPGDAAPPKPAAPPAVLAQWAAGRNGASGGGGGGGDADDPESTAVVLVHSGGGGVFAWRNVMGDLAARCGVRVVAFDRPAFGLTSRPPPPPKGAGGLDPYSPAGQALLLLQLCGALGIRRAVLVAHGDGCLVAVMAAALVAK